MRRFFCAVFLVVACATVAAAGPYEDAAAALQRKDYRRATQLFRPLAEQGNAGAQNNLGLLYGMGQGVRQDDQEALKWYRKAAVQGNAAAQEALGVMYVQGRGVPQDAQEAVKWYRRAAKQGDAQAQFSLRLMYDSEQGVPQDLVRAHLWYHVAAAALRDDAGKKAMEHRDRVASQMTPRRLGKRRSARGAVSSPSSRSATRGTEHSEEFRLLPLPELSRRNR